jgi:hypothetical protein
MQTDIEKRMGVPVEKERGKKLFPEPEGANRPRGRRK